MRSRVCHVRQRGDTSASGGWDRSIAALPVKPTSEGLASRFEASSMCWAPTPVVIPSNLETDNFLRGDRQENAQHNFCTAMRLLMQTTAKKRGLCLSRATVAIEPFPELASRGHRCERVVSVLWNFPLFVLACHGAKLSQTRRIHNLC